MRPAGWTMPRVTEHALDVGRDRGIAAQQLVAAFRRRRELGAALGTAALDFRGHAATPLRRASASSSNVLPSSTSTAARPVNFDQRSTMNVDKGRRQLHSIAPSAFLFGRDKGGARARERLVNQLARLVRSRLGPRQQAHCSSPAKKWSPGHQPLLVLPRKLVQTTGTVADLYRRVDAL
jgi:hypothetical protein